jgi:hypothetical protein
MGVSAEGAKLNGRADPLKGRARRLNRDSGQMRVASTVGLRQQQGGDGTNRKKAEPLPVHDYSWEDAPDGYFTGKSPL